MIKVGLVGEDPNDTLSVKALLLKRYSKQVSFCQLIKGIKGHYLDNPKTKRALKTEADEEKCRFIIFIRDLDAFGSEKAKMDSKTNWFKGLNEVSGGNNIFMLNIWELESLILGDIETFNKLYKISYQFKGDPHSVKNPKELLKRITSKSQKKYKESHCSDIFSQLNLENVEKNCSSFKSFLKELQEKVNS